MLLFAECFPFRWAHIWLYIFFFQKGLKRQFRLPVFRSNYDTYSCFVNIKSIKHLFPYWPKIIVFVTIDPYTNWGGIHTAEGKIDKSILAGDVLPTPLSPKKIIACCPFCKITSMRFLIWSIHPENISISILDVWSKEFPYFWENLVAISRGIYLLAYCYQRDKWYHSKTFFLLLLKLF